jgi:hypothetical protein
VNRHENGIQKLTHAFASWQDRITKHVNGCLRNKLNVFPTFQKHLPTALLYNYPQGQIFCNNNSLLKLPLQKKKKKHEPKICARNDNFTPIQIQGDSATPRAHFVVADPWRLSDTL